MRRYYIFLLSVFLMIPLFSFVGTGQKWKGISPVIKISLIPKLNGFKSTVSGLRMTEILLLAANEWNTKTGSTVSWMIDSVQTEKDTVVRYFDPDAVLKASQSLSVPVCQAAGENSDKLPVVFSTDSSPNADCTSGSCTYIWSCEGQIVSADVTLNNWNFNWNELSTDGDSVNLFSEILKNFGMTAGLSHCRIGDSESECTKEKDPTSESVLHKFTLTGIKNSISTDDVNGIQSIYGVFALPFPSSGKYALNYEERTMLQSQKKMESIIGVTTPEGKKNMYRNLQMLTTYNSYKTKKDLREMYDEFISKMDRQTSSLDIKGLKIQRMVLLLGIYSAHRTKEDAQRGYNTMDTSFIDYTIGRQLSLWQRTIDALGEYR